MRPFLALTAALAAATPVFAAPERQSVHRDWEVYRDASGPRTICFAVTRPEDATPKALDHGDVFMLVSNWSGGGPGVQPSFHAGYELAPFRAPELSVGSRDFDSYADANEAFIEEAGEEAELVSAMRRGSSLRVEAQSANGDFTAYEFSLMGVSAAIDQIERQC